MRKNLHNRKQLERDAQEVAKSCRQALKFMYREGYSPESALMEMMKFVPLKSMGPITKQCAFAILYLETQRRILAGEVFLGTHRSIVAREVSKDVH